MTLWQTMRAFLVRRRKALLIALAIYLALMVGLALLSRGPQTEPFLYQIR